MSNEFLCEENWSKRFLPHYNATDKFQMITYRLNDSLPQTVLKKLAGTTGGSPVEETQKRKLIEGYLDKGYGSSLLKNPKYAQIVFENWLHFNKERYEIIAFTIMPNHIHILIKILNNFKLDQIVHSWKSYTSHKILKMENDRRAASGPSEEQMNSLWQREYWDRLIRDQKHYKKAIEYIHMNPVKAGLVNNIHDWQWSSCYSQES